MKKIIFILFIFPAVAFSQSSLGIKAGLTFSSIANYSGYTFHAGPNLGLIYSKTMNHFQITVEPSYNQKGYAISANYTDSNGNPIGSGKASERLNFFDLPITFGWLPLNDNLIFGLNAGVVPCLLLSSKYKMPGYSGYSTNNNRSFNVDLTAGAKIGGKIGNNSYLTFNLRYGTQVLTLNSNINGPRLYYINSFVEIGHKF